MKFKDIQEGDVVCVQKTISIGRRGGRSFFVFMPVERTTPKQFIVDGERYQKEDGKLIGKYFDYAYYPDDDMAHGEKAIDETKAMQAFQGVLDMRDDIDSVADKLTRFSYDHPEIEKIHAAMVKVEELFNKKLDKS